MVPLLLALVTTADARPPKDEGPSPEELAAAAAAAEAACARDTPENFQIHTGVASDPDEATAVRTAISDARSRAITSLCAGKSAQRCLGLQRHLEGWKTPHYNPHTLKACAHVGVHRKYIDDLEGEQAQLERDVAKLAARIADKTSGRLITLAPPVWATSGCSAGEVGLALTSTLRNDLGTHGLRLTEEGDRSTKAVAVRIKLTPRTPDVVLSADLREPGKPGLLPLEGFDFAQDLFVTTEEQGDCRWDSDLGLVDGQRLGTGGHEVRVTLGTTSAQFCEGEQIEPRVQVNRPSVVKVYSIARDGEALLVWPPPGQDGRVDDVASLGEMNLVLLEGKGDEKLLAIAVPTGGSHGPAEGWTGFCKLGAAISAAHYPSGAAIGTSTYTVQPEGQGSCPSRPELRRLRNQMPTLPECH